MRKRKSKIKIMVFFAVIAGIIILGCVFYVHRHAYLKSHNAVPANLIYDAEIPGMPDARLIVNPENFYFSDTLSYRAKREFKGSFGKLGFQLLFRGERSYFRYLLKRDVPDYIYGMRVPPAKTG